MFKRLLLAAVVCLVLGGNFASAQTPIDHPMAKGPVVTEKQVRAFRLTVDLMYNHPDPEAARDLSAWFKEDMSFLDVTRPVNDIKAWLSGYPDGTEKTGLAVNPGFMLAVSKSNHEDDRSYKQVLLYVAYVELKWHRNEKRSMGRFVSRSVDFLPPEKFREQFWEHSLNLIREQWGFIERQHLQRLFPVTSARVKANGEELGILISSCRSLIDNAAVNKVTEHVPYWEQRCKEEEDKIRSRIRAENIPTGYPAGFFIQ